MRKSTIVKSFVDTNIFIYAQDAASSKQEAARNLLRRLTREGSGVVSTQVMQEFYQNLTRKLGSSATDAADLVRDLRRFEVVLITPELIDDAMALHSSQPVSFWDSLIVSAAAFAKCRILYSEDMANGQTIGGVRVQNPVKSAT